jgi:hypothetical protein
VLGQGGEGSYRFPKGKGKAQGEALPLQAGWPLSPCALKDCSCGARAERVVRRSVAYVWSCARPCAYAAYMRIRVYVCLERGQRAAVAA